MHWRFFERKDGGGTQDKSTHRPPMPLTQLPIRCPLCGKEFAAGEEAECAPCALAKRCGLVMCPNCSYEFAP
jgi:hypothetical protein